MTAPPPAGVLTITLFVPGVLVNPLNGAHGHWTVAHREARKWKRSTRLVWLGAGTPRWEGPARVTLTAYTGKLWDEEEGVAAACKHVRDEAVRLICDGVRDSSVPANDGPASGHTFQYRNETRERVIERGVLVEVTPK